MTSLNDSSADELAADLASEFLERVQRGENPTIDEYCEAYPEAAEQIRELLSMLMVMENVPPESGELETKVERDTPLPEQIGDYRVVSEIGRGGMGIVYEAEQISLDRRVALKVLPNGLAAFGNSKLRFQQEARAAAKMHHTNIVPVFEVGEEGTFVFYAMQLITGQSLDRVIEELGNLRTVSNREELNQRPSSAGAAPSTSHSQTSSVFGDQLSDSGSNSKKRFFRSVAKIGVQIADALAFAHERGVIHRDIKPSNLLLDAEGVIWVSDFGLAKLEDNGLTQTGDYVGTLRYMSPERFEGKCDVRADVYALGLTLYELALQRPAFESFDRLKLIQLIHQSDPVRPRSIDPRVPRDLETIILKAIEKEPRRRYKSAGLMEQDLQRFLNDEPIQARRSTLVEQTLRWARRNRALAGSLAAMLSMALIMICVLFYSLTTTRTALNEAKRFAASSLLTQADAALDEKKFQTASLLAAKSMETYPSSAAAAKLQTAQASCPVELAWTSPVFGRASAAVQSSDGKWIATASVEEDIIWVWNESLELQQKLIGHKQMVTSLDVDDSNQVLSGSKDQTICLWDIESGEPLWSCSIASAPAQVAIDPKKRWACAGGVFRGTIWLWDLRSGKLKHRFDGVGEASTALAFSSDGSFLAAGFSNDEIKIWDLGTMQHKTLSNSAVHEIQHLAFLDEQNLLVASSHGATLLRATDDGNWQVESLGDQGTFQADCIATNSDRSEVTLGSSDGSIRSWDWPGRNEKVQSRIQIADSVKYLAYGRDGSLLISTDNTRGQLSDRPVCRIDRTSKQPTAWIDGHTDRVTQLAFSSNGKRLTSLSEDNTIRVWDTASGKSVQRLGNERGKNDIRCVAIDGTGETIFAGAQNQSLYVWNAGSGKRLRQSRKLPGPVHAVAISPTENVLAWMTRRRIGFFEISGGERFLLTDSGRELETYQPKNTEENFQPRTLVYSADGKWIACGTSKGKVLLWSTDSGELVTKIPVGKSMILNIVIADDGQTMSVQDSGSQVKIFDVSNITKPKKLKQLEHLTLSSMAMSPDGKLIVTGVYRSEAIVWNVETGQEIGKIEGQRGRVDALRFSKDGSMLASTSNAEVQLWRIKTDESRDINGSKLSNGMLFTIDFSHDDRWMLVKGLWSGMYRAILINQSSGKRREFPGVFGASLHPRKSQLAVSMRTGELESIDLESGEKSKINHDGRGMKSLEFNADGSLLAGSQSGVIRVWKNDKLLHKFSVIADRSSHRINFHPINPSLLANAGADGVITLWDLSGHSPRCTRRLDGHRDSVTVVRFSRDGKRLISCAKGEEYPNAILWDVQTGRELQRFVGHTDDVWKADISPDGRFVATASRDHTVRLWDVKDGAELRRFEEHTEDVFDVRFSADGQRLFSVAADGTVRVRSLSSRDRLEELSYEQVQSKTGLRLDGERIRPLQRRVQWHIE